MYFIYHYSLVDDLVLPDVEDRGEIACRAAICNLKGVALHHGETNGGTDRDAGGERLWLSHALAFPSNLHAVAIALSLAF